MKHTRQATRKNKMKSNTLTFVNMLGMCDDAYFRLLIKLCQCLSDMILAALHPTKKKKKNEKNQQRNTIQVLCTVPVPML